MVNTSPNTNGSTGRILPRMAIPADDIVLEGKLFWELMDEGWRFYLDQNGKVLGYFPPTLKQTLEYRKARNA